MLEYVEQWMKQQLETNDEDWDWASIFDAAKITATKRGKLRHSILNVQTQYQEFARSAAIAEDNTPGDGRDNPVAPALQSKQPEKNSRVSPATDTWGFTGLALGKPPATSIDTSKSSNESDDAQEASPDVPGATPSRTGSSGRRTKLWTSDSQEDLEGGPD
jgi:hypothetical protein